MLLSGAVPIEPPICCETLTVADATPASAAPTPRVPRLKHGANTKPRPIATSSSDGRIVEA
jgi:hypothetical protein